ncbi:type VI secretion system-associated FHA domain protein TagH [Vibrio lentus]|uniref:type VI secretion system-associated FHA domain protein TagH n=1 Tax=Vibrio lentus TaxID=136468 RepID=UPI000C821EE2|nr:type VI secretion system-associated FHA domain protein TagH [Vibrio lentus]PMG19681.1 FHA domain-containing protein [Vibrio lentus]PMH12674.1 FHA domain-containing protein [Vibrio lentus]PMJ13717.1 FHA domain-containing protein [Vibrio lentus]PMK92322.1 FHA domain-containing protein [Vibrio lentus]PMN12451.1 FHA domain-containing protein [Vibrio lentus]
MRINQLVLVISKCPEEYVGAKSIEMPEEGGSIGREAGCTVSLTDHNRFISGTHCLLSVYGDTYYISDISTNGTLVNGNKILKNQPVSLCDGDRVSLGQYEVSISLELVTNSYDIASEIAPERDSTDPLMNLEESVVEEEAEAGTLEDLFMETKPDGVETHDPVEHLKFSMQRDDDYLVRDESNDKSLTKSSTEHQRQVVDDSLSIHSEFDLPSLIPEDWMGMEEEQQASLKAKDVADDQAKISNRLKPASVEGSDLKSDTPNGSSGTLKNKLPEVPPVTIIPHSTNIQSHKWEEVTQEFVSHTEPQEQPVESESRTQNNIALSETSYEHENVTHAFFEGLGVDLESDTKHDALFFKQMGACLRLCIDNLYKDLQSVEELTDESSFAHNDLSLTTLMLTLNSQNLLAPNELIEQILDELSEHDTLYAKAINDLVLEQLKANDPQQFANTLSQETRFLSKSKLWKKYSEHYEQSTRQFNESTFKALMKDRYNKVAKADHA